jgi:hypothetical protein
MFRSWRKVLVSFFRPTVRTIRRRPAPSRRRRLLLEGLESRLAPATFTDNAPTLNLVLNVANVNAAIVSNGTNYKLTLTGDTWSGTDDANVTGNGTATLTVTSAGITAFTNGISLADSAAGTSATFNDSGANSYANNFMLALDMGSAGISFNGASRFGTHSLNAQTDRNFSVNSGALVSTSSGGITLSANEQATPTSGNFFGISVAGTITSATGAILLQGKGGNTSILNHGILVTGTVSSTGTGAGAATITLVGSGGAGADTDVGIFLTSAGASITSVDGAIQLTGTGGATGNLVNDGILTQNGAQVSSTGAATITLTGTGGTGGSDGIFVGSTVSATGTGNIILAGTAVGTLSFAIDVGGTVSATGTGNITLTGDSMNLDTTNGVINAGTNTVTLRQKTDVALTVDATLQSGHLSLTDAELDRITAGQLVLGRNDAGFTQNLTINSNITTHAGFSTLVLESGGNVTETGGSSITVTNLAVQAATGIGASGAGNALSTTVSNLVANTATGGIFISNTGALTIGFTGEPFAGVMDTGASGDITLTSTGTMTLNTPADSIAASNGTVTLNATGANADVLISKAIVTGDSAVSVAITAARDVILDNGGEITFFTSPSRANAVTVSAGRNITLQATSNTGALISANTGGVILTAGPAGDPAYTGFTNNSGLIGGVFSVGGNITISADDMVINDPIDASGLGMATPGIVTLDVVTAGRAVTLGTTVSGTLSLLQTDLNNVTASILRIGNLSNSGSITVTAPISDVGLGWSTLSLLTEIGAGISQNSGATLTVTNLQAAGNTGVTLNENNVVSKLAGAAASGAFSFTDSANLSVDTVDSGLGFGFGTGIITDGQAVSLTVNVLNDSLTVNQTIDTTHNFGNPAPGGANINLSADNMALNNNSPSSTINAGTNGILTLTPFTPSNTISVGGADAPGTLGIDDNDLTNVTAKAVRIGSSAQTGAITVGGTINTHAGYNTLDLIATGSGGVITQTTGSIAVANLALQADAGIGSAGAIAVVGPLNLAFRNATSNNVQITSTGALTINTVDQLDGTAGHTIGNFASGGTETLQANSPITFASNDTSSGTITATTTETASESGVPLPPPDDDITVNSGVTVESTGADVNFTSADNIIINSTASVLAPMGNITFTSGSGDNDTDGGQTINGTVSANATTGVVTLNVSASGGATEASTGTISGASLVLLGTGTAGSFALGTSTTNAVGTIAASTAAAIDYMNSTALAVGAVGGTTGISSGNSNVSLCTGSGDLTLNDPVNAGTGTVGLHAAGAVSQGTAGQITATNLGVVAGGDISLDQANPTNHVTGTFAANTPTNMVRFQDDTAYAVGMVAAFGCFPGASGVSGSGGVNLCSAGNITITTSINAGTGTVRIQAGGTVSQALNATITAGDLGVRAGGSISLCVTGSANHVTGQFAADTSGGPTGSSVQFLDEQGFTVGTVTAANCFTSDAVGVITNNGDVDLVSIAGSITIGTAAGGQGVSAGAGTVRLSALQGIVQTAATTPNTISAANLAAVVSLVGFGFGEIDLCQATNNVTGIFAANNSTSGGFIHFKNGPTITVGTVAGDTCTGGAVGVTTTANAAAPFTNNIDLVSTTGNIVVGTGNANENVSAPQATALLTAALGVSEVQPDFISAANLGVVAQGGPVALCLPATAVLPADPNDVTGAFAADTTAAPAGSAVMFLDSAGFAVDTVRPDMGDTCITTPVVGVKTNNGDVDLVNTAASNITLIQAINTTPTGGGSSTAMVRLDSAGGVTQTSGGAGAITALNLAVNAAGNVDLCQVANFVVGFAAADTASTALVAFLDSDGFAVDSVAADTCAPGATGVVTNNGDVDLVGLGGIILTQAITTTPMGGGSSTANVRLDSVGPIFQTSAMLGGVGAITALNLAVNAAGNVDLCQVANVVPGAFAAADTGSNASVHFLDIPGFTVGAVTTDACAPGARGVSTTNGDADLVSAGGDITIGTSVGGEGISAGTATVRLQATTGSVLQTKATVMGATPNAISSQNLGVLAANTITLDQETNKVTGVFAANGFSGTFTTTGNIKFCDDAITATGNTLTIATVPADSCVTTAPHGVLAGGDVTIANGDTTGSITTGSIVIGTATGSTLAGGEGIVAGSNKTVRLQATGGSVLQTKATGMGAMPNAVQGQNLGVFAASDILLDQETNKITGGLAAMSMTGNAKFCDDATTATGNTLTISSVGIDSCFTTAVQGVMAAKDVTLANTGSLVVGDPAHVATGGEGIVAGASNSVRLTAGAMVTQTMVSGATPPDAISGGNLGVQAQTGIHLGTAKPDHTVMTGARNAITGLVAMSNATSGNIEFLDKAATLTVDSVASDLSCFSQVVGITGAANINIDVQNDGTPGSGNLTVNQEIKSGGMATQSIHLTTDRGMTINPRANAMGHLDPTLAQLDAGLGNVLGDVGQGSSTLLPSEATTVAARVNAAKGARFEAQPPTAINPDAILDSFQIRPSEGASITVIGENPTILTAPPPGDKLGLILDKAVTGVSLKTGINDPNLPFSFPLGDIRNTHGTFTFSSNQQMRDQVIFQGIESLGGLSLGVTSILTANNVATITVSGSLAGTSAPGSPGTVVSLSLGGAAPSAATNTFLLTPSFVSPTSPFSAPQVAIADVNGDGIPDIIIANGPGDNNPPTVRVIDGNFFLAPPASGGFNSSQEEMNFDEGLPSDILAQFTVFDPSFRGGLSVAAGVLDKNTMTNPRQQAQIVVGLDADGPPVVSVYTFDPNLPSDPNMPITHIKAVASFMAYDASFRGGVRVGVGGFNPSLPKQDPFIAVAPGPGAALPVEVFDATTLNYTLASALAAPTQFPQLMATFSPYGTSYADGVVIAANSFTSGGPNEILTGNELGQPIVAMFDESKNFQMSMEQVAFQPGDIALNPDLSVSAVQPFNSPGYVPPNGISSVAFGGFDGNMQGNMPVRDILVGAGAGNHSIIAKLQTNGPTNVTARHLLWAHARPPRATNIASGGS